KQRGPRFIRGLPRIECHWRTRLSVSPSVAQKLGVALGLFAEACSQEGGHSRARSSAPGRTSQRRSARNPPVPTQQRVRNAFLPLLENRTCGSQQGLKMSWQRLDAALIPESQFG